MKASTKLLVTSLTLPLIAGAGAAMLRMQSNRMRALFERDLTLPGEDIAMTIGPDDTSAEAGTTSAPLDTHSEDLPALAVIGDSWIAGTGPGAPSPAALMGRGLSTLLGQRVRVRACTQPGARGEEMSAQIATVLADSRMRRSRSGSTAPRFAVISMGSADLVRPSVTHSGVAVFSSALNRLEREGGYRVVVLTCPNLGLLPGVRRPLRTILRRSSRVVSGSQWLMAVSSHALPISLNQVLSGTAQVGLLADSRRSPSPLGYKQIVAAVLARISADLDSQVLSTPNSEEQK